MASLSQSSDRDSRTSRITPSCPPEVAAILGAAWDHDAKSLKPLLDEPGKASVQDPTTKETPLHAAIRSCGPGPCSEETIEAAKSTIAELFQWGAIWNDIDNNNETPGCVATRLGQNDLYTMCVAAGVRAEMLFGLLDGYEELESEDENEDEEMGEEGAIEIAHGDGQNGTHEDGANGVDTREEEMDVEDFEKALAAVAANADATAEVEAEAEAGVQPDPSAGHTIHSATYLASSLTYDPKKLVDEAGNGVMMAWETDIMWHSVIALLSDSQVPLLAPSNEPPASRSTSINASSTMKIEDLPKGKRILNIGFGMGIIDTLFTSTSPSKHHIIEAHPAVLSYISTSPDSKFGPNWVQASLSAPAASSSTTSSFPSNHVHAGRWQTVCPLLLAAGEVYDAIYFDTFGEDYAQLRAFFTEYVPGLLDQDGKFCFFNGLGADRKICYDVYQQVVEMHLSDAGHGL